MSSSWASRGSRGSAGGDPSPTTDDVLHTILAVVKELNDTMSAFCARLGALEAKVASAAGGGAHPPHVVAPVTLDGIVGARTTSRAPPLALEPRDSLPLGTVGRSRGTHAPRSRGMHGRRAAARPGGALPRPAYAAGLSRRTRGRGVVVRVCSAWPRPRPSLAPTSHDGTAEGTDGKQARRGRTIAGRLSHVALLMYARRVRRISRGRQAQDRGGGVAAERPRRARYRASGR